ncbi:hypothetical protein [Sulfitobacter sp. R18_1]|uniref:hypothetical protein n=1 Tax=Sulfitobacter sp. R18_1 TaxID=2821104 RepID=UPI001ADB2C4D|nr:hypothetical protein [Sulfitobacter sp. R18_1]MBO9427973.1 hypothetical protein [Sulfitobacter sp. R18_1]
MAKRSISQRLKEFLSRPPQTDSVVMSKSAPNAIPEDTAGDQASPERNLITETYHLIKKAHSDTLSLVLLKRTLKEQFDRQKSGGHLRHLELEDFETTCAVSKITGHGNDADRYGLTEGDIRLETKMSGAGWYAELSYKDTKLLKDDLAAWHHGGPAVMKLSGINPNNEVRARILDKVFIPLCDKLSLQVEGLRAVTEKNNGLIAKADLTWATYRLRKTEYEKLSKPDYVRREDATPEILADKLDEMMDLLQDIPEDKRPLKIDTEGSHLFPATLRDTYHIDVAGTDVSIEIQGGRSWRESLYVGAASIKFSGHTIFAMEVQNNNIPEDQDTETLYKVKNDVMADADFIRQVMDKVLAPVADSLKSTRDMYDAESEAAIEAAAEELSSAPSFGGP